MKKSLLFVIAVLFSVSLFSQNRAQVPAALKNLAVKTPAHSLKDPIQNSQIVSPVELNRTKAFSEEEIGQTVYDLMTNRSCYNRTYLYPDGTIAAVWTMVITAPSYADRGTGYNYFDGSAWGTMPAARIESVRTGFPSYSPYGANGELVVCHSATTLLLNKRDTKGTGAWTQITLPFPTGTQPTWPRVCVSGTSIHILADNFNAPNNLMYYRSQDGGTTWDIQGVSPAGADLVNYPNGFDADCYDWALPVGNTLAFIVGDKATDLILMKSTDNGSTWTKTVIFQHPYPLFEEVHTLTPDTPYVCDASHAITLDANGTASVAFGLNRFLNSDTTDATYSFFPGVDGIAFWKEGDPAFTSANPNDVYALCKLVGYIQDIDNSGVVLDNYTATSIPDYQISTTSMPQITFGSDGNLYLIFRSLVETMMSGGGQFYSHIWGRKSTDGGDTWSEFIDLTTGPDHELVECVFPSMSPTSDGKILFTYMSDFEPGTSLGGDADVAGTNSIMFASVDYADFSSTVLPCVLGSSEVNLSGKVSIYPNPVLDNLNITFSFNKSTDVNMTVLNVVGSTVMSENFIAERGETKQVNVKELPVGIYLVKFKTTSGTFTQKIIKN